MHLRPAPLLVALLVLTVAHGAQATFEGLSLPFHDPDGNLTHRMTARRGTMERSLRHLEGVKIDYFSATEKDRVVQRITAAEATWDDKKEVLTGRGAIQVETEENRLEGEGFVFVLATGRLDIQRKFTMANREFLLTSDRAEVDLVLHRAGDDVKLRDVRRCEAIGNLRLQALPTAPKKKSTPQEVFADRAIYDGATHTIHVPDPHRVKMTDGSTLNSNVAEYKLDEDTRPATKLK